jgi:hypothetical protein
MRITIDFNPKHQFVTKKNLKYNCQSVLPVKIISASPFHKKENFCLGRIISQLPGNSFSWVIGNDFSLAMDGGRLIKKRHTTPLNFLLVAF